MANQSIFPNYVDRFGHQKRNKATANEQRKIKEKINK